MAREEKKILYLCADTGIPYPGTKGGSIHIGEIVGALQEKGFDVTVIANAGQGTLTQESTGEIIDLPDVGADSFVTLINDVVVDEKAKAEMMEFYRNMAVKELLSGLFRERRFHYIYERYSLFSVAGLRFAGEHSIPFVLEVNSPLITETARYRRLSLGETAGDIERYLFNRADHIVVVSEELKDYVSKISPHVPITVVPNGVRVEHFQNENYGDGMDGLTSDLDDADLVVGFSGSLKPWHGVEDLIEAFADFSGISGDGRLLIIGGKESRIRQLEKRCLKKGVKDRVVFTGAVPYNKVPALLRRTDVLVAPYPDLPDFYFSALKIFEYMAAGKAIIASAIGQIQSVLTHEKTALLIRPGNKNDLRDALVRIKGEPLLMKRLGENALAEVSSKHTWRQRAETLSDILAGLGNKNKIESGAGHAD